MHAHDRGSSRFLAAGVAVLATALVTCRATPPSGAATPGTTSRAPSCGSIATTSATSKSLELVVLGSGGPGSAGRAASSYLFTVDGTPRILVDVGPGAFVRLGETRLSAERLDTILLTHLHIDHAGDLAALVKSRDLSTSEPVEYRIIGPAGRPPYPSTSELVDRLFGRTGAWAYLPSFRNELRFDGTDVAIDMDAPPRRVADVDGVAVSAVSVDHGEVPALAYRLDGRGRSFVVSGDLASRRGGIEQLARGADVLVYDATVLDPPASPEGLYALHTAPKRIGEVAASAGVKHLVLGHIPPIVEARRDEVLASIRRSFRGDVRVAADCMRVAPE